MTIPENREIYGRLANGPMTRNQIDDVEFHPKRIYQFVALGFNNDTIFIELPTGLYNLHSIGGIDINDMDRIRITRDCE